MQKVIMAVASCLALWSSAAGAQQVSFGKGWTEQRFSLFSSNEYSLNDQSLDVRSNGTASLLWSALPRAMWSGQQASWEWTVKRSVPETDLTRKGGDDRNLSLYFLFLPEAMALKTQGSDVRTLLKNPAVRVLMYVWGGSHALGEILPSPYLGSRGRSVIQRMAGTGSAMERVDLVRDHRRAFGTDPASLVGLAVSSDSDDTGTQVLARIAKLSIK